MYYAESSSCFSFIMLDISFPGPYPLTTINWKQVKIEGFMQSRWQSDHPQGLKKLMGWYKEVLLLLALFREYLSHVSFHVGVMSALCLRRGSWRVGSTSPKALKTCQLLSWGCCREKTSARLSSLFDASPREGPSYRTHSQFDRAIIIIYDYPRNKVTTNVKLLVINYF